MNIVLDLNSVTEAKAHAILTALATCYAPGWETVGDPTPRKSHIEKPGFIEKAIEEVAPQAAEKIKESLGNKLKRQTEERLSEEEKTAGVKIQENGLKSVPGENGTFGNLSDDSQILADQVAKNNAGDYTEQQVNNAADLSAGPPIIQHADDVEVTTKTNQTETQAPATTTAVNLGPLDKPGGLPWDARIHTASKGKMASGPRNGCWKYKPKTDKALIAEVEAELAAAVANSPAEAPTGETESIAPAPDKSNNAGPPIVPEEAEKVAEIGEVVQHTFNSPADFKFLLKVVTDDVAAKKMPMAVTSNICRESGHENIMALGKDPTKYQEFHDTWVALRNMIALDPTVAESCLADWETTRQMLKMAVG